MGKVYAYDGQYDEATKNLVRSVDLARQANDSRAAAMTAYQLGLIFADRGRYGAAVSSIQDALNGLSKTGEQKSRTVAEVQNDLAAILAQSGRMDEALTQLKNAEEIARQLHNDSLSASLL